MRKQPHLGNPSGAAMAAHSQMWAAALKQDSKAHLLGWQPHVCHVVHRLRKLTTCTHKPSMGLVKALLHQSQCSTVQHSATCDSCCSKGTATLALAPTGKTSHSLEAPILGRHAVCCLLHPPPPTRCPPLRPGSLTGLGSLLLLLLLRTCELHCLEESCHEGLICVGLVPGGVQPRHTRTQVCVVHVPAAGQHRATAPTTQLLRCCCCRRCRPSVRHVRSSQLPGGGWSQGVRHSCAGQCLQPVNCVHAWHEAGHSMLLCTCSQPPAAGVLTLLVCHSQTG